MGNISNENKSEKIKKEEVFDNSNIIGTSSNKNNSKNLKKEEVDKIILFKILYIIQLIKSYIYSLSLSFIFFQKIFNLKIVFFMKFFSCSIIGWADYS